MTYRTRSAARPFLLVGALLVASCSGLDPQRVMTERATYDWFAPLTKQYIQADSRMDDAAKRTHLRAIEAWDSRLKADEIAAGLRKEGQ